MSYVPVPGQIQVRGFDKDKDKWSLIVENDKTKITEFLQFRFEEYGPISRIELRDEEDFARIQFEDDEFNEEIAKNAIESEHKNSVEVTGPDGEETVFTFHVSQAFDNEKQSSPTRPPPRLPEPVHAKNPETETPTSSIPTLIGRARTLDPLPHFSATQIFDDAVAADHLAAVLSSVAPPLPILPLPVPPLTQSASAANHLAVAFSTVAPPLPILPLTVPPLTQAVSAANHLIAAALSAAPPPLPILPIPVRPAASSSATVVAAPIPVLSAAHSGGGGLPPVDFSRPPPPIAADVPIFAPQQMPTANNNEEEKEETNDLEIVVFDPGCREYANNFQNQIREKFDIKVEILYPRPNIPTQTIIENIKSRGVQSIVSLEQKNKNEKTINIRVLRGALRNVYKNLPQKEALQLLGRIYKHTKQRNKAKADEKRVAEPKPQKEDKFPKDMKLIVNFILRERPLSILEYDKIIKFLVQKRHKLALSESEDGNVDADLLLAPVGPYKDPEMKKSKDEIISTMMKFFEPKAKAAPLEPNLNAAVANLLSAGPTLLAKIHPDLMDSDVLESEPYIPERVDDIPDLSTVGSRRSPTPPPPPAEKEPSRSRRRRPSRSPEKRKSSRKKGKKSSSRDHHHHQQQQEQELDKRPLLSPSRDRFIRARNDEESSECDDDDGDVEIIELEDEAGVEAPPAPRRSKTRFGPQLTSSDGMPPPAVLGVIDPTTIQKTADKKVNKEKKAVMAAEKGLPTRFGSKSAKKGRSATFICNVDGEIPPDDAGVNQPKTSRRGAKKKQGRGGGGENLQFAEDQGEADVVMKSLGYPILFPCFDQQPSNQNYQGIMNPGNVISHANVRSNFGGQFNNYNPNFGHQGSQNPGNMFFGQQGNPGFGSGQSPGFQGGFNPNIGRNLNPSTGPVQYSTGPVQYSTGPFQPGPANQNIFMNPRNQALNSANQLPLNLGQNQSVAPAPNTAKNRSRPNPMMAGVQPKPHSSFGGPRPPPPPPPESAPGYYTSQFAGNTQSFGDQNDFSSAGVLEFLPYNRPQNIAGGCGGTFDSWYVNSGTDGGTG